ncbi:hypothetical protein M569_17228 [Genlisea aurea]|uniref:Transmembrane protein n=1 Tax=Genlisea aurea TaxID=192259 RepID=S8BT66_9LAMI|nr:hypothetical protein M569_17228 [Genlisea aurea]
MAGKSDRRGKKCCRRRSLFSIVGGCFGHQKNDNNGVKGGKTVQDRSSSTASFFPDPKKRTPDKSAQFNDKRSPVEFPIPTVENSSGGMKTKKISQRRQRREEEEAAAAAEEEEVEVEVDRFPAKLGAVILTTAMAVTVFYGKVLAVFITVAWFYMVPYLRKKFAGKSTAAATTGENNAGDVDLDSWEYKRRVVLQGFLDRKHTYRN